jgi:hypothetical protein
MGESPSMSQADAARQLGLTEGAVKVQTLRDPSLVDEELRHLIEALA